MNRYEFVVLLDSKLPQDKRIELINSIETMLEDKVLEKDDIWMLDTEYKINREKRAYYLSYYIETEWDFIENIKKNLSIIKWVLRFTFFKMSKTEKFFKFSEINKQFELSNEEKTLKENDNAFKNMETESKRK